jgi:hypothetical protein
MSQQYNNSSLPDDDMNLELTNYITQTILSPKNKYYVITSNFIKKYIHNYKHFFNIVEEFHENNNLSSKKQKNITIKETYNISNMTKFDSFLYSLSNSKDIFFYLFDSIIFFSKSIIILNKSNIFPIYLDKTNIHFHNNNIPCITNLSLCYCKKNTNVNNNESNISYQEFLLETCSNIDYSCFISPDIFALKYAFKNKIKIFENQHIKHVVTLIENHYSNIIPLDIYIELYEDIKKYMNEYYLHMSLQTIMDYNSENFNKHSSYSLLLIYVSTITQFFHTNNNTIKNIFIQPFVKYLNPKFSIDIEIINTELINIFYEKSLQNSNMFEIIHSAYKRNN